MTTNSEITRVGVLRSDIAIELHTIPAIQIWYGRAQTEDKHAIISMTKAVSYLRMIELSTTADYPYADFYLTNIYERLGKINQLIENETSKIEAILKSVPRGFSFTESTSIAPVVVRLFINVPTGYQLVFLLNKLDLFIRQIQLARHISLIAGGDASDRQERVLTKIRSLIVYITKFDVRFVKAKRKDFANNTVLAQESIEKYGTIPDAILSADKNRSRAAPILNEVVE